VLLTALYKLSTLHYVTNYITLMDGHRTLVSVGCSRMMGLMIQVERLSDDTYASAVCI